LQHSTHLDFCLTVVIVQMTFVAVLFALTGFQMMSMSFENRSIVHYLAVSPVRYFYFHQQCFRLFWSFFHRVDFLLVSPGLNLNQSPFFLSCSEF
ncbi:MAG: hypothetical protein ACRCU2_27680, partial [Planktothrix sp.]